MRSSLGALVEGLVMLCTIGAAGGAAQAEQRALSQGSTGASALRTPNQKGWWVMLGTFSERANALQHVDDVAARCGLSAFHDLSDKFPVPARDT